MLASYHWICALLGERPSPERLADALTAGGLTVDAVAHHGAHLREVRIARVLAKRPHPQRDKLTLVTLDAGHGALEVVCGAPNVPEPGGLVCFAPVGTKLPGMTLEPRVIAGVQSLGMLCAEDELGVGDDHAGILVLPEGSATAGQALAEAFPGLEDWVL